MDFDDIEETVIDGDDEQTPAQSRKINGLESEKKSLPVYHYKNEFLNLLKNNQVIIIVGETGSGKTTQLPQYLYEGGYSQRGTKLIGCTQPRRIAAVSVAQRVAELWEARKVKLDTPFDLMTTAHLRPLSNSLLMVCF